MTDRIAFIVSLPGKAERRDDLKRMLLEVVDRMSAEPDFVNAWIHHPIDDPNTIVVYETWACNREHFLAHHLNASYRAPYEAALPDLLDGERRIEFLTPFKGYLKTSA